ncbi:MAG: hypothetical protein IJI03_09050 [Rudaea sp.]|uniref:hypothetical protein n=2 Tax=unclassified Rudaea TaxID=2627037 RepID=UPI0010F9E33F|nr:hypothetical protein [Rudaea sp.]MBR0345393.1 hypothetical protein [Rudaea sp.]
MLDSAYMLRPALHVIPESLRSFLTITEIDDAEFLVGELFQRKFKQPVPDFPRHIVALYRDGDGAQHLLSYSHMRPFGDIYLSGGSCSNGETVKRMQPHEREAMYAAGGSWFLVLKYAFERYADCCDAFFGYTGDARAQEVAIAAGWTPTEHDHLYVNWHKPLPESFRRALLAKAHAIGEF